MQVSWAHHSLFFRLDQLEVTQETGRLTLRGLYETSAQPPTTPDAPQHELTFVGASGAGSPDRRLRALGNGLRRLSAAKRAHGAVSHFCACTLAQRHPHQAQWCAAPQSWPAGARAPAPSTYLGAERLAGRRIRRSHLNPFSLKNRKNGIQKSIKKSMPKKY